MFPFPKTSTVDTQSSDSDEIIMNQPAIQEAKKRSDLNAREKIALELATSDVIYENFSIESVDDIVELTDELISALNK